MNKDERDPGLYLSYYSTQSYQSRVFFSHFLDIVLERKTFVHVKMPNGSSFPYPDAKLVLVMPKAT